MENEHDSSTNKESEGEGAATSLNPETSIHSPFRYAGGKFYARTLILPRIPPHNYYCEPLAGGASIFFAKIKVASNWLNDCDEELTNCLIQIRDKPEHLIAFLAGKEPSKKMHAYYKNEFKPRNAEERGGRWFLLNRMSYSGIMKMENCFWGYGAAYSMAPRNWAAHIRACSAKLQDVQITCRDFEQVIDTVPPDAFLFVDPPYFSRDQDKFYAHTFRPADHARLAAALKRRAHQIKFLLTYDDNPAMREMYSWCSEISAQQWTYTVSRTDDQSGKTANRGRRHKGREMFITNYASEREHRLDAWLNSRQAAP